MYHTQKYDPNVITYEDRSNKGRDYVDIGYQIVEELKQKIDATFPSKGVIMLPSIKTGKRKHDELAALIVREMSEHAIQLSVIHDKTIREGFAYDPEKGVYFPRLGKIKGYIQHVSLNKILLHNNKWPFVLASPLFADLTIGIDVKHHTAGYVFIDKNGKNIRLEFREFMKDKEKLSSSQVFKMLIKEISKEAKYAEYPLENIVIHRDGRIFDSEIQGINQAVEKLKSSEMRVLPKNASVHIVEISKSSPVSLRFYKPTGKVKKGSNRPIP